MIERELLLTSTVAVLLTCLVWMFPGPKRRLGGHGFALVAGGSLIPLLDPLWVYLTAVDRIDYLTRLPLFGSPLAGCGLIAGVMALAAFIMPGRRALKLGFGLGAGYLLHLFLLTITPVGIYPAAPFTDWRLLLPVFPPAIRCCWCC